jgi:hypothetical protein
MFLIKWFNIILKAKNQSLFIRDDLCDKELDLKPIAGTSKKKIEF